MLRNTLSIPALPCSSKNLLLLFRLTVLLLSGLISAPALATGFVVLHSSGFNTTGGLSAYTLCNNTGPFSQAGPSKPRKPTVAAHNTCAVFPTNEMTAPEARFSLVTHAVHKAVVNNSYTGGLNKKIANVTEYVWRNAEQTECIYGARVVNTLGKDADYDAGRPGIQYFEINDFVRGGFAGLPVAAAYSTHADPAQPVYRIGRTFTSVQYRRGLGYAKQPLTEPAFEQAINDAHLEAAQAPTTAQQSASLNDNWVDFTTSVRLPRHPASAMFYVKTTCSSEAPKTAPGAIRLRQTTAPFIEISVPGFVPPGGAAMLSLESPL